MDVNEIGRLCIELDATFSGESNKKRNRLSKLYPYREEILRRRSMGYSLERIARFLQTRSIFVDRSTVFYFLKKLTGG